MIDPLLSRAVLAIEESHSIREQRKLLSDRRQNALNELRRAVFESASTRAEIKAHRDDRAGDDSRPGLTARGTVDAVPLDVGYLTSIE